MTPLRLGISPCPNDTFAFHGLLTDRVDRRGLDLEIEFLDIQELNDRLAAGTLDAGKASFHAALHLADRYGVLPVGAALGFGVGPLCLARREGARPGAQHTVLCPGADTTATLLFRVFHPAVPRLRQVRFDAIMPALARGEAEFGVVIHEGRFTYPEHGLSLVEDLGRTFEERTGGPLPLGGLLARRDLAADVVARLVAVIRDSLDLARADPAATVPTMRRHAQEFSEAVLFQHVDLYVNDHTRDLGAAGRAALRALEALARERGAVAAPAALAFL